MTGGGDEGLGPAARRAPLRTTAETDNADLARGAGVNYLGYVARLAPRILFLVLAGRFFGQEGFGIYTFGITVVETAAAVSLLGMKLSLYKFMSEAAGRGETVHRPIANAVALAVTAGTVLSIAVAAGADPLASLFRLSGAGDALRIFALAIPAIVVSDILLVAIRFTRQMRFEVYARSLAEPVTLTLAVPVVYWAGLDGSGLAVAYTVSLVVAAAVTLFFFARLFPMGACLRAPLRWGEIRRLAAFSGPTAGYDLLLMLGDKIDIFLISYFTPASVVGVYGMARQFSTVTKKIRAGFDRILPTVFAESVEGGDLERADRQLAMVARWILTVEALVVLFFAFFGEGLLGLLEAGFAEGALVLATLTAADAIQGSLGIGELPFVYLRPAGNLLFGAALLGLGAATNVWLIQAYGAEGAALAVLLTVTVVNGARVLASHRMFGLSVVGPSLLKPVAAAVPAALAVLALRAALPDVPALTLALGLPALVVVYLGALVALGLEPEDRAQLRRVMARVGH